MHKILTSSSIKIADYKRSNIQHLTPEKDFNEVLGTPLEVLIYKLLSAPDDVLVEDTTININGQEIVDFKTQYEKYYQLGTEFHYTIYLGLKANGKMYITKVNSPTLVFSHQENVAKYKYDFDYYSYFKSTENELLAVRKTHKDWCHDHFNPRFVAIHQYQRGDWDYIIPVSVIKPWTGAYQDVPDVHAMLPNRNKSFALNPNSNGGEQLAISFNQYSMDITLSSYGSSSTISSDKPSWMVFQEIADYLKR